MPELPEVEIMRQGLENLVVNQTIETVDIYWDAIINQPAVDEFKKELEGEKIESMDRRGKYLIFRMRDHDLVSHLRMTGGYSLEEPGVQADKHVHVVFQLASGQQLFYHDIRKFGRMDLVPAGQAEELPSIQKLGPEPFFEQINIPEFSDRLLSRPQAIKEVLLDQTFIAGLGNIYADETLYRATIHPLAPANSLERDQMVKLYLGVIEIIRFALAEGGSSIRNYRNAFGEQGNFQNYMKVYGKEGEPCDFCTTPIEKITVANRGTHFCPECQKRS